MIPLMSSIHAEVLKLKRSNILLLTFVTPLSIVGLIFSGIVIKVNSNSSNAWLGFQGLIFSLWSLLMLPLFISLEMALLGQLESSDKLWKHLFVLPIPRRSIYETKLIIGTCLVLISSFILGSSTILAGFCISLIKPNIGFKAGIPWVSIFQFVILSFFASLFIVAVQTWLSLRWQSFTFTIGLGMIETVIGQIITNSSDYSVYYPWSFPPLVLSGDPIIINRIILTSVLGFICISVLGCWDMIRVDVK